MLPNLSAHWKTSTEAEHTHKHSKLLSVRSEEVGPVVHQASHQGLNIAELAVNTEDLGTNIGILEDFDNLLTRSMMKNIAAQKNDAGRERTNSG